MPGGSQEMIDDGCHRMSIKYMAHTYGVVIHLGQSILDLEQ